MKQIIVIALLLMCTSMGYAQRNNNNHRQQTTVSKSKPANSANAAKQRQLAEQRRKEAAKRKEQERIELEKKNALRWDESTKSLCYDGQTYPMVYVSGGSFTMGEKYDNSSYSSDDYTYRFGDQYKPDCPLLNVTLDSYYIGQFEVTQDLWKKVLGDGATHMCTTKGDRKPMTHVAVANLWTIREFLSKLNALTGQIFRLPTEEQWEFAARGGVKSQGYKYSGSNSLNKVGWYYENSGNELHDVGLKEPNELGIYDMSGNVAELISGSSTYGYYKKTGMYIPGHIMRGGYYTSSSDDCSVSKRRHYDSQSYSSLVGVRLVLAIEE